MADHEEKVELREVDRPSAGNKKPARPPTTFERMIQPCLGELIGTTFFVFIGCVSVIENVPAAGRVQPALVHGLAVAVMVACMANIRCEETQLPFIADYILLSFSYRLIDTFSPEEILDVLDIISDCNIVMVM